MPDTNVTIRHARHAIYMVLNGAVRDIEANSDDPADITALFRACVAEIADWEIPGTFGDLRPSDVQEANTSPSMTD